MNKSLIFAVFLLLPAVSYAQGLQEVIIGAALFTNNFLIPFLIATAFLLFLINAVRYFIIESDSQDGRENAKSLAVYSVSAFVLLIVFWGIVNMISTSIGLEGETNLCPDYQAARGDC